MPVGDLTSRGRLWREKTKYIRGGKMFLSQVPHSRNVHFMTFNMQRTMHPLISALRQLYPQYFIIISLISEIFFKQNKERRGGLKRT